MSPTSLAEAQNEINRQHAQLAIQLDELAGMLLDVTHRQGVAERLRDLLVDVGLHFGFEELVMQEHGYAQFEHHRRQHIGIMTELAQLLDKVQDMVDPAKAVRCVDFLAHWYRQHVAHSDQSLLDWLETQS